MLHNLIAQRAASASTPAFLAAAAEIYPHQVRAALTVLSDPVQRYLLADEVGLGKTIQAGYVVLQTLIDNPQARVVILTPDSLRRQWVSELRTKFFTDDFPRRVKIASHDSPEKWEQHRGSDLVVVDEAHLLVQDRDDTDPIYRALCDLVHPASKVLLLSATPVTSSHTTHLGLLHLLEPNVYKWSERRRSRSGTTTVRSWRTTSSVSTRNSTNCCLPRLTSSKGAARGGQQVRGPGRSSAQSPRR
ncbi:SNF2-related protein [Streptomyces sp. AD2-2]|nr:SNF2-related protein [Streptomyces sp. AD2-2]